MTNELALEGPGNWAARIGELELDFYEHSDRLLPCGVEDEIGELQEVVVPGTAIPDLIRILTAIQAKRAETQR